MMAADGSADGGGMMGSEGSESYPGIPFTPPAGTVGDETEGQGMVTWEKVGDGYTFTEFEGKPLGQSEKPESEDATLDKAFA